MKPAIKHWYWVAGIYEGEGTCYTNKKGKFRVVITQNGAWLPGKIQGLFGGRVYQIREGHYAWCLYGQLALQFIEKIRPVLSPRRIHQLEEYLSKRSIIRANGDKRRKVEPEGPERVYEFISNCDSTTQAEIRSSLKWGRARVSKAIKTLMSQGRVIYTGAVKSPTSRIVITSG